MSRFRSEGFPGLGEDDLATYADARAAEIDLIIAEPFRPDVLENLMALQVHARRLDAALQDLDSASSRSAEPGPAEGGPGKGGPGKGGPGEGGLVEARRI